MANINNFLSQLTRVPSSAGPIVPIKLDEPYPTDVGLGEMERIVLKKIQDLAASVRLDLDIPKSSKYRWLEYKLEPHVSFIDSIKRIVYLALLNPTLSIVYVKNRAGMIEEIKSFISATDNHELKRKKMIQFADYIDATRRIDVPQEDVDQYTRYAEGNFSQPVKARQAELAYHDRWQKFNSLTGTITTSDPDLLTMYKDKEKVKMFKDITDIFNKTNLAFIAENHSFSKVDLMSAELGKTRDDILEWYCDWYGLPRPLFYTDLNVHTPLTLSSAHKDFRLGCLEPIFEPIFADMSNRFGFTIKPDYSKIEVSSAKESLEIAQAGFMTINEIRKDKGLPPLPPEKGDQIPNAAGAPANEEKKDGEENKD